jgi:hypothetical protein
VTDSASTTQGLITSARSRRAVIGRRVAVSVLALFVAAGASGWLGVHAETVQATESGYRLTLTYPRVARAGLDIPWEVRLTHLGGFDSDITIAISSSYFDIFEYQGMHPNPSDETSDGRFVYLTFSPPKAGDVFTTSLDTYVQPGSQIGRHAVVEALVHGSVVAHVNYSTLLFP